jgi:hypothetical protein
MKTMERSCIIIVLCAIWNDVSLSILFGRKVGGGR